MMSNKLNEGWVVFKTMQVFSLEYPHITELWISSDATRGMLDAFNLGQTTDKDATLARYFKEHDLLPLKFVDKVFRGTNNFYLGEKGNRTVPDILFVEEAQEDFKSIHAIECKKEKSDRLWAQMLRVRGHVDYAWASLPYDASLLYEAEIRHQRFGLVAVGIETTSQQISQFSDYRLLNHPMAQSYLRERKETIYRINELHGLERISWDSKFETNHILHTRISLHKIVALLFRFTAKITYSNREIQSILHKAKGDFLRLKFLVEDDEAFTLSYGCLKIQLSLLKAVSNSGLFEVKEILQNGDKFQLSAKEMTRFIRHEAFERLVLPQIRHHFLQTEDLQTLIGWLTELGGKATMFELFSHAIRTEKWAVLKWLLIGNQPSTAPSKIKNGSEICLNCGKGETCAKWVRQQSNKIEMVMAYRQEKGREMIARIRSDDISAFQELLADPLYIKFLVPYTLVQENKRLLVRLGILSKESAILSKSRGLYCPFHDVWELSPLLGYC